jgi:hypothetical protein
VGDLSFDDVEASYRLLVDSEAGLSAIDGNRRRVVPGEPEQSLLWLKLSQDDAVLQADGLGASMPMGGQQRPAPETLAVVRAWIEAGAPREGADFEPVFVEPEGGYLPCDATDEAGLRACLRPEEPDAALRLESPAIEVPPFSEIVVCAELATTESDLLVSATQAQQMVGGHHVALFVAIAPRGDSTPVPCLDDMTGYRYITAGDSKGARTAFPEGQALKINAGEVLVLQSHYINTTAESRWVMDSMDLISPPADAEVVITDALIINTTAINIPAGAEEHEVTKTCRLESDLRIELVTGHTHEFGIWFELEAIPAGGEAIRLFQSTDGPVLRDFAGFHPAEMDLQAGDALRITCRWSNPTDGALRFPREMCAGVMYYTPGTGALLCDTTDESPRPWADVVPEPGEGEGCVAETAMGNALGVGRYCTAGGTECLEFEANFCLAAFDPTANYCSIILCEDDGQCGEGASCVTQERGSACVPLMCQ